jgi:hypothetical protein
VTLALTLAPTLRVMSWRRRTHSLGLGTTKGEVLG